MRYKAIVSYDGSNFNGFQRLNEDRSVQKGLEDAISVINKNKVIVKGASRTDKGVHALHQVISFDMDVIVPVNRFIKAVNKILPDDIRILSINIVNNDFHARYNVYQKTYIYKINLGEYDVLKSKYYFQPSYQVDINSMMECYKIFLGIHNFKNFVSGYRTNYVAKIDSIDFKYENNILTIIFKGKSFYKYMVRNIVGALFFVATGRRSIEDIKIMLDNYDKNYSLYTAPASGLYLVDIKYNDEL